MNTLDPSASEATSTYQNMSSLAQLVPASQLLAGRVVSDVAHRMYTHPSLINLAARFMRTEAFVMYVSKDYPICQGKSREWVASFLVFNYVEFVSLLKLYMNDDRHTEMSPPFILDAVWHEHLLDTRGYDAFCSVHLGATLHHDADRAVFRRDHYRFYRISKTIAAYVEMGQGCQSIQHLAESGLWWPELNLHGFRRESPPFATATNKRRAAEAFSTEAPAVELANRRRRTAFKVRVQTLTGRIVECDVTDRSTMTDVAKQVATLLDCFCDQMVLLHAGKVYYGDTPCRHLAGHERSLEDIEHTEIRLTLKELGVDSDTLFYHVLKLRGC
ncbi:hypothetical protein CYMTET_35706 [Cymbomonas tetramitiformis]|uniref:Rad60/SUMO-like domain-containing protein n=1 Tax=Cymbomonas tetramitiformis TaxID=36881 RepID=A0AAE0KNW0_9CHLO|nr:hypothetical protein CYMTET_35706 [Cymbomonas tetramitiformis]|eukprot:gene263-478_t